MVVPVRPAILALAVAMACDEVAPAGPGGAVVASDYLDGVESATWRDNEDTGDLDDATVLRGQLNDAGVMEVRRGKRFVEGEPVGSFAFSSEGEDLTLSAWTWGGEGSDEPTFLARASSLPGDKIENGAGSCTLESSEGLETYFGTFDFAISSTCEGAPAPDGVYWFAPGVGLVKADTTVFFLDLVSPH